MGRKNGARYDITEMYFGGREWLSAEEKWLSDVSTVSATEEKTEPNVAKEVFSVATKSKLNILKELLKKYSFWKPFRITAWIYHFQHNHSE